ncbi:MAG: hypothetical protein V4640_05650 [Verrucomicrobiota bacterium]
MLEKKHIWKPATVCLVIAAVVIVFVWNEREPNEKLATHATIQKAKNHLEKEVISEEKETIRIRNLQKRVGPMSSPGRSKQAILNAAQQLFGQAEAARARKLEERFENGNGIYLYVVEQPSKGEVQTVKSQIADLREEVAHEDREDFDKQLEENIVSYDPYGEKERKVFLITVPADRTGRMSGLIVEADDLEELRKKFVSGESQTIQMRQGFYASYDGKTLERFEQLMVWQPE